VAAKLYRQGAHDGDASAALKLGLLLFQSPIDGYEPSGVWFIRACELGSSPGCHDAGVGFEYGHSGLTQSYEQAEHFYRVAADRGYIQSQYNLGSLYANRYLVGDVAGLKWILVAQSQARACGSQPSCKWILDDPPQHGLHL